MCIHSCTHLMCERERGRRGWEGGRLNATANSPAQLHQPKRHTPELGHRRFIHRRFVQCLPCLFTNRPGHASLEHALTIVKHHGTNLHVCVCVCVCVRERERERERAIGCVCVRVPHHQSNSTRDVYARGQAHRGFCPHSAAFSAS